MKKLVVIAALLALLLQGALFALPRYALMTGAKCGSCHVNPTGGEMRTEYGSTFSLNALPLKAHKEDDFSFNPKLTDNISIGGDARGQFLYDFAKDPSDSVKGKNSFQAMTASFYGSILLSKKISFYFKQDFVNIDYGWSYSGPEVFGIAKLFPHNGYIKAGIFMPDYGWRLDDHTTYTRGGDISIGNGWFAANGLFFNPNYKDIGVESGFNIDDFTITASILNGTGNQSHYYLSTDKAYTGKIEYLGKVSDLNYRLGVSGYGFKSYKMGAITAGFAYDDWILYGEVDFTHHKLLDPTNAIHPIDEHANMSAAFAELDFQAIQGLWLTGKYDMSDPFNGIADNDLTPTTNAVQRLIFGLEFFPYSFVELRPQYRHFIEKPSADNDQALIQLHMWF